RRGPLRLFYDRAERFKHLTHALSRLNDEVFMEVNKDGARFWLMSPDKTSMAYIYLPYHSFSEFEVPVETAFSLSTDELDLNIFFSFPAALEAMGKRQLSGK
uniref:hypothetical protein n=1 Tax=Thermoflexus sp. TaxID=1969742 RepID=UPI002ADE45F0